MLLTDTKPPSRASCNVNYERHLFHALLIAYLIPLFQHQYFPTVDGPAHLYNARLIVEILTEPQGSIASFHGLTGLLKPNVLGHFLLAGLMTSMPAFMAEKVVLILMVIGLPLAGRYILSAYGVRSKAFTFMLFPFTYSYLFYFGFYNFNLGVVLYLFALGVLMRYLSKGQSRQLWILALLSLFIALAHIFVLGILLISVFILNLHHFLSRAENHIPFRRITFHQFLVLMPGLAIIVASGIGSNEVGTELRWLPFKDILVSLKYVMPIKGVQYDAYDMVSRTLLYILTISVLFLIGRWILDRYYRRQQRLHMGPLAYLAAITLVLIFVLPDETGSAGVISARLMHVFFIIFLLWLGTQHWPKSFRIGVMISAIAIDLLILNHNVSTARTADLGDRIVEISASIPSNSLLLPITSSQDPLLKHIANYAGVDGRIVVLENYEAALSYFPITWDLQHFDDLTLGDMRPTECIAWPTNKTEPPRMIDHIMVIRSPGENDLMACLPDLQYALRKYYQRIDQMNDERIQLYRVRTD